MILSSILLYPRLGHAHKNLYTIYAGEGLLNQVGIITVASSVAAVFIVASILLFTGYLCRWFHRKKKRLIDSLPPAVTYRKQLPHYDDVQFPCKQELPLKPNESYHSR